MDHAIETGKTCTSAPISVLVEFLLRHNISAALFDTTPDHQQKATTNTFPPDHLEFILTSQEKETIVKGVSRQAC
jgi:hypothetical protein